MILYIELFYLKKVSNSSLYIVLKIWNMYHKTWGIKEFTITSEGSNKQKDIQDRCVTLQIWTRWP